MPEIDEAKKELREFYNVNPNATFYPTGITLLDEVAGGGLGMGYPGGKFVNLAAPEGAGKTFLGWHTLVANTHYWKQKGVTFKWMYDDAEKGSTMDLDAIYGLEVAPENLCSSDTIDQALNSIRHFLEDLGEGEKGIYILDSLDPLKTIKELEKVDEDLAKLDAGKTATAGSYAVGKQKFLSNNFFPKLNPLLEEKDAVVIIISQVRYNITGFGAQYSISGGKAMDHAFNTRIMLEKQKNYEVTRQNNKLVIGYGVKAKLIKNKCPRPGRSCQFDIYFTRGIDDIGACVDYLYDLKTPQGMTAKSKGIEWDGVVYKNKQDFMNYVRENKLSREVRRRTVEKWEELESAAQTAVDKVIPEQDWEW